MRVSGTARSGSKYGRESIMAEIVTFARDKIHVRIIMVIIRDAKADSTSRVDAVTQHFNGIVFNK